jgi:hypothetical protein
VDESVSESSCKDLAWKLKAKFDAAESKVQFGAISSLFFSEFGLVRHLTAWLSGQSMHPDLASELLSYLVLFALTFYFLLVGF